MPLDHSKSNAARVRNIKTLTGEIGKSPHVKNRDQAIAIAMDIQRRAKKAAGGVSIPRMIGRMEQQNLAQSGFMHGLTAGRADHVPVSVKANSYVVPADVVSAIGQGNSNAGAHALSSMFKLGPYGSHTPKLAHMKRGRFADGGVAEPTTDIQISDGEFTVPPEAVAELGAGDMKHGHEVLDAFVKHVRQRNIKTLRKLPSPKKS